MCADSGKTQSDGADTRQRASASAFLGRLRIDVFRGSSEIRVAGRRSLIERFVVVVVFFVTDAFGRGGKYGRGPWVGGRLYILYFTHAFTDAYNDRTRIRTERLRGTKPKSRKSFPAPTQLQQGCLSGARTLFHGLPLNADSRGLRLLLLKQPTRQVGVRENERM